MQFGKYSKWVLIQSSVKREKKIEIVISYLCYIFWEFCVKKNIVFTLSFVTMTIAMANFEL